MTAGRIILLNGASSSGKSSVARALQARLTQPYWHISIDHLRDAGVLPLDRVRSGEFAWSKMREAFFAGFERSLVVYAEAGNNLVVSITGPISPPSAAARPVFVQMSDGHTSWSSIRAAPRSLNRTT